MGISNNTKASWILLHVMIWIFIFAMPLIFNHGQQIISAAQIMRDMFMPLMLCITFYVNYCILAPNLFMKGKKNAYILLDAVVIILLVIITQEVFSHCFLPHGHGTMRHLPPAPPKWMFYVRDAVTFTLCSVVGVAVRMSSSWTKAERARQEAEIGRKEAELKNLRNQINPHFLLNTLNNIYALTMFDTAKAQKAIQELSRLLRYLLYDNQNPYTSLRSEIGFLKSYIDLMRMRTSDKVKISVDIDIPDSDRLKIAPLLFIPIVENAFKHGISLSAESFINIKISAGEEDGIIDFYCDNSNFPKDSDSKKLTPGGIGLQNLHKRLESIYRQNYHLQEGLTDEGRKYYTHLIIKTNSGL